MLSSNALKILEKRYYLRDAEGNLLEKKPEDLFHRVAGFVASYSAPIIMMSQNRAEERDRKKFEIDLATDRKAEREIEEIQTKLEEMDSKRLKRILELLEKR